LGVVALGALITLAVAGVTGATAVLVTGAALLAMIGLGNFVAGRHTPEGPPTATPGSAERPGNPGP
jgi:hypothetical protein